MQLKEKESDIQNENEHKCEWKLADGEECDVCGHHIVEKCKVCGQVKKEDL